MAISGDRAQTLVHLPADLYPVVDKVDGRPTGELKSVAGTPNDYRSAAGGLLPDASTSVNFPHLSRVDRDIDAWLAGPAANYAIRVRGLSKDIRTLHL